MGGLLDKPKVVQPPPVPPPPPVPTEDEEVRTQAKRRRPRGRLETFLTGDLIPETGKKTTFG